MITTIQLDDKVKRALDRLKENKESYEEVIIKMMSLLQKQKRSREDLMIEGCKEMYQAMKRINKEWESVDSDLDWEWNEN